MGSWTGEVKGRLGFGCMRLPGGPVASTTGNGDKQADIAIVDTDQDGDFDANATKCASAQ